jgi:hypothetical protein
VLPSRCLEVVFPYFVLPGELDDSIPQDGFQVRTEPVRACHPPPLMARSREVEPRMTEDPLFLPFWKMRCSIFVGMFLSDFIPCACLRLGLSGVLG